MSGERGINFKGANNTVTIKKCYFADVKYGMVLYGNNNVSNNKIFIENTRVYSSNYAIYQNGSYSGLDLAVSDSSILSSGEAAVYISGTGKNPQGEKQNQKLSMTKCIVKGTTGIEGKFTDMVLTDCEVFGMSAPGYIQYNSGNCGFGFAVVSTDNSLSPGNPEPAAMIKIDGGKYYGYIGYELLGIQDGVEYQVNGIEHQTIDLKDNVKALAQYYSTSKGKYLEGVYGFVFVPKELISAIDSVFGSGSATVDKETSKFIFNVQCDAVKGTLAYTVEPRDASSVKEEHLVNAIALLKETYPQAKFLVDGTPVNELPVDKIKSAYGEGKGIMFSGKTGSYLFAKDFHHATGTLVISIQ